MHQNAAMNADVSGDAVNISIRDKVEIMIYNVLGQKIRVLVNQRRRGANTGGSPGTATASRGRCCPRESTSCACGREVWGGSEAFVAEVRGLL